jgi:hypothetical protein
VNETVTYIRKGQGKIVNLDAKDDKSFIAYTDRKEIVTRDRSLIIDMDIRFPRIRFLDREMFLLADTRTIEDPNVYIFNYDGELLRSFLGGDGIEDIVIHNNKIIVTFFDEGVFGADGPNNNGLSVFSFNGDFEFGYNANAEGSFIASCYCICKQDTNKVLFYAYDFFNVIELDLDVFSWKELNTPAVVEYASAMTSIGNKIIFHSCYREQNALLCWDREQEGVIRLGEYTADLRGLDNGKFLAFGEKGFTIIDTLI